MNVCFSQIGVLLDVIDLNEGKIYIKFCGFVFDCVCMSMKMGMDVYWSELEDILVKQCILGIF